jgi:hypothetical protein
MISVPEPKPCQAPKACSYDDLVIIEKPLPSPRPATLEEEFWDDMLPDVINFTKYMQTAHENRGFLNDITPKDAIAIFIDTIKLKEDDTNEDDEDDVDYYEEVCGDEGV